LETFYIGERGSNQKNLQPAYERAAKFGSRVCYVDFRIFRNAIASVTGTF